MISHDKRFAERSVKRLWNMLQCGMDWHSPLLTSHSMIKTF